MVGDFAPNLLNIGNHSLTAYRYSEGQDWVWWVRLLRSVPVIWLWWFATGLAVVALSAIPGWLKRILFPQQARSA